MISLHKRNYPISADELHRRATVMKSELSLQTFVNQEGNLCQAGDVKIDEFLGSYTATYRDLSISASKSYRSLLGIFECPDDVFYQATAAERLEHFSLDQYSVVAFRCLGQAPCAAVRGDRVIDHLTISTSPTQVECGGLTYVLASGSKRRTSVFIRKSVGLSKRDCELEAMIKMVVLFHELGHVSDIETSTNYGRHTVNPLKAELYAHHFACRALIKGKFRIALGWYLDQLAEMPNDDAAAQFIETPEYGLYRREISPLYRQRN